MKTIKAMIAVGALTIFGVLIFHQIQDVTPKWKSQLGVPDTTISTTKNGTPVQVYKFQRPNQIRYYATYDTTTAFTDSVEMVAFKAEPHMPGTYQYRGYICPKSTYDHRKCARLYND